MRPLPKREIEYAIGAPETGKSTYCRTGTAGAPRRLVWDPMREHTGDIEVRCARDLLDVIQAAGPTLRATIIYVPTVPLRSHFENFCIGAMSWGDCWVTVEELAGVSPPGRAPEWWGMVLRESRHYRLRVYANTQRPQEADKTIFGVFSKCAVFELPNARDRDYVERALGLSPQARAALDKLRPHQYLEVTPRGGWKSKVTRA